MLVCFIRLPLLKRRQSNLKKQLLQYLSNVRKTSDQNTSSWRYTRFIERQNERGLYYLTSECVPV